MRTRTIVTVLATIIMLSGTSFHTAYAVKATPEKDFYKELTSKASKDAGLFNIYETDGNYYFEIPDSLFGREMFLVTRYAKTAMDIGYGGQTLHERVLLWEKRNDKVVDLCVKSFLKIAKEGSAMYEAVQSSSLPAIITSLDIKGVSPDLSTVVVDVTDLYKKDVLAFGLDQSIKKSYSINSLDEKSSYVAEMKSFPINIEVKSVKTYTLSEPAKDIKDGKLKRITLEIHNSMLLLPKEPMMPRLYDERMGFFSQSSYDYGNDNAQSATRVQYIARWRLEPSDMKAYMAGKLVEPIKPIVLYISPNTPPQWIPYIKQGIEDWQVAFEAAGFKNAIIARDFPTKEENPDFDPLDARYSVVEYFASEIENANGPHVPDPRSGEIINTHIYMYHNSLKLVHDWYMVQCGPLDKRAQQMVFDEELMGELFRRLVCHEVGHTLGLMHNFGASSAYPVDSLRSASFTGKYGIAGSIMDYSRYNYVAQPEDNNPHLVPIVGPYDKFVIEWGYRVLPNIKTPEDERIPLNNFIKTKAADPYHRYNRHYFGRFNPKGQTEDVGDDAMKASAYGLKNLKIVMENLEKWTYREGYNYNDLKGVYTAALVQWQYYMRHVANNLSGTYEAFRTMDQQGAAYEYVPKEIQKEALDFLCSNVFDTPLWLLRQPYIDKINDKWENDRKFHERQVQLMAVVIDMDVLLRLCDYYDRDPENGYNPVEYLADARKGIWRDIYGDQKSDTYRRAVERAYLYECERSFAFQNDPQKAKNLRTHDFLTLLRYDLTLLRKDLNDLLWKKKGIPYAKNGEDKLVRQHYEDCIKLIDKMLNPKP